MNEYFLISYFWAAQCEFLWSEFKVFRTYTLMGSFSDWGSSSQ